MQMNIQIGGSTMSSFSTALSFVLASSCDRNTEWAGNIRPRRASTRKTLKSVASLVCRRTSKSTPRAMAPTDRRSAGGTLGASKSVHRPGGNFEAHGVFPSVRVMRSFSLCRIVRGQQDGRLVLGECGDAVHRVEADSDIRGRSVDDPLLEQRFVVGRIAGE